VWGTLPFVFLIMAAIVILCFFPQIATGLPDHFMGIATRR
jgi:C4-dicarboxylate transporter, DctM subunit